MSTTKDDAFDARLRAVFLQMASLKKAESRNIEDADAFVFHVKDCVEDFKQLCALRDNPGAFREDEAKRIMQGMLYHALPHLIAAARLYDYVPDFLGKA